VLLLKETAWPEQFGHELRTKKMRLIGGELTVGGVIMLNDVSVGSGNSERDFRQGMPRISLAVCKEVGVRPQSSTKRGTHPMNRGDIFPMVNIPFQNLRELLR